MLREQVISALQGFGWDTWSACDLADGIVERLRAKGPGTHAFIVSGIGLEITIR